MAAQKIRKKLVVVGDSHVGKTSLLMKYKKNIFLDYPSATIFENDVKTVYMNGKEIDLHLWDTAGEENYDRLRPMSYPNTDVFVLCFSIAEPSSFNNLTNMWIKEVRLHCPDVPVVVVGNKRDLREDVIVRENLDRKGMLPVAYMEGVLFAQKVGAVTYLECSALTNHGVREVFETATKATLVQQTMESLRVGIDEKSKKSCVIL